MSGAVDIPVLFTRMRTGELTRPAPIFDALRTMAASPAYAAL